ncbi:MAG: polyprenyl synthetase family protein [Chloroflexaceae bacterium]|nr:polyprenyl synthetase family protein [Chloroflexaceae bacterium]
MNTPDIRATIQKEMQAAFPAAEARVETFYGMMEYHLGWRDVDLRPAHSDPGKLLRPQLALLACAAVGGTVAQAFPLAAALQLIHDFSLIHDDIEDDSDTRRGRVTVWKQWGLAHGINTGDGMFVIAHLALLRLLEAGVPAEVILAVVKRFEETILTICEGQYLDLSFEGNLTIDEADYLAMIGRKTAVLISSAAGLGAMVGGADPESCRDLFDFGLNVGLAFQIEDDRLGIWGDPAVTGKPRAADIYRRKVSLPIVHALRHADNCDDLARIYQQAQVSDDDVTCALAVLEAAGSRDYSGKVAARYHTEALQSLGRVRVGAAPEAQAAFAQIQAIAENLLGRQA